MGKRDEGKGKREKGKVGNGVRGQGLGIRGQRSESGGQRQRAEVRGPVRGRELRRLRRWRTHRGRSCRWPPGSAGSRAP
ncbi:MAG: hypothetical protein DWQ36_19970 [Acidobacteria bacterium]|nr:MAG: hypothetical protein DWQ30_02965 [Acidobacteriota bacterium]REK03629.1 MAG: hypothetical protein DWQ36_19970 [Acidobacteriota bacterium]